MIDGIVRLGLGRVKGSLVEYKGNQYYDTAHRNDTFGDGHISVML